MLDLTFQKQEMKPKVRFREEEEDGASPTMLLRRAAMAGIPRQDDGDLAVLIHDLPHRRLIMQPQRVDGFAHDLRYGSDCCERVGDEVTATLLARVGASDMLNLARTLCQDLLLR